MTTQPTTATAAPDLDLAIEVSGLTKRFGERTVIDNVALQVPRGSTFGYLGLNGAGKTTLIRVLLGLTPATSGTMSLLGLPVPSRRAEALAKVGAIVDEPRFHGYLTGRENLSILAAAREPAAHARIPSSLQRVGLADRADDAVARYSMGMRQRLGVAACLLGDPELMILDEPMNGLDPAGMLEFRRMIGTFVDEGRTVVLSSHLLDEVEKTCDAVAIVDGGRVVSQGPIASVISGAPVLRIGCGDPDTAVAIAWSLSAVSTVDSSADGVVVHMRREIDGRSVAGELNRRLVESDIDVYSLELTRPTLEDRFLEITSTLGARPITDTPHLGADR
ncbi:MAG TPA: ABC transporter ATP-binding protein [Acidimicrobiales bacterium]|nr:ABC transporter ATP-binding protein [Acidimicrobiales bacterium]